jgi:hypothetical protein
MTEDRLNGLALLHTHNNKDVDRVRVLDKFDAVGVAESELCTFSENSFVLTNSCSMFKLPVVCVQ